MAAQVYAVASGKGGVGKTTTVVNLGVVLRRADHTVALVDADLGMANLGTVVGVTGETTLHDVLAGEAEVDEALVEEAPGFAILTGSEDLAAYPEADPEGLRAVLDALRDSYEYVLVDTGAGMSHEDVLPLGLADRVILVTTPEPAAIGDTRKTAELADLAEGAIEGLVVTMADDSTDAADIADQIGVDLLGVIPYDATVRRSTTSATPLEAVAPESPAAAAYRELATALAGEPIGEPVQPAETAPEANESAAASGDSPEAATPAQSEEQSAATEPAPDDSSSAESTGETSEEKTSEADEDAESSEPDPSPAADDADPSAANTVDSGAEATEATGDDDDLDEYLEELEEVEPAPSGGFFAKLRRLFR